METLNADQYFGGLTVAVQELTKAEKRGGPIPKKYDFAVQPVCAGCQQHIMPPKKVMRCEACKSIIYCSKECQTRSWTTGLQPRAPTHRQLCPQNRRHMQRVPETQAIIKMFPWGRVEKDGSFSPDVAKARYKVLGGSGFGFWSHRGGPVPHQQSSPFATNLPYAQAFGNMLKSFNHLDGKDLTKDKHLTDEEGWKLPNHLIPYRDFTSPYAKKPVPVADLSEPVADWETWYQWRKLPKESPVALIMHTALTVYQLLVKCLEVTSSKVGRKDKRVPLHVHFIGAEVELNYLPTFSELALLLPYHDITLVFFGSGVTRLLAETSKFKSAVANKTPVFGYTAPTELGSGSITVHFHTESPLWSTTGPNNAMTKYGSPPDALVSCNAGLGSYNEWIPIIRDAHRFGVPFATTEYAEQSLETQRGNMPLIMYGYEELRSEGEYVIDMNPFQKPGRRGIPMYRLPNMVNGFTFVVWKKKDRMDEALSYYADKLVEQVEALELGALD